MKKQTSDLTTKINTLLNLLGIDDADIHIEDDSETFSIQITLPEETAGSLIGHHGRVIDSLQLISSLLLNNHQQTWKKTDLNINNYRQQRQDTLYQVADRAVENAINSGNEVILSYLPSNERRLVHEYLSSNDHIETYSQGEGRFRRLIIAPILTQQQPS